jgi:threonine dehydrogenase-like Zn-dependent dehydrogenase
MALAVRARDGRPFISEPDAEKRTRTEDFQRKIGIEWHRDGAGCDFDVVINAAPSTDTLLRGVPALRNAGCFCLFSGLTDNKSVPAAVINEFHYRQLRLAGAYGCTRRQMRAALAILLDHRNEAALLIEKRIGLEQVPHGLSKILASQAMKFVVEF